MLRSQNVGVLLNDEQIESATKFGLISAFVTLFILFSNHKRVGEKSYTLKPFDLLQLGLATYRLGHLTSYDKVTEPLRGPFTETKPDPTGAGETVDPKGSGVQRVVGELIACPICSGTWIAAALVYGLHLFPTPTRILMTIMSTIGAAELMNAASEALSWSAQRARQDCGTASK